MATGISKYINYLREAFLNPMHLMALGVGSFIALGSSLLLGNLFYSGGLAMLPFFGLAALEFFYLGITSRNPRFISNVNAKYGKEIEAYEKAKNVTQYFNSLSGPRQRRFDHFKSLLEEVKENHTRIHGNYPDIVNAFITKVTNLQLTYVRLLYMQDRFPAYLENEKPEDIHRQIADLKADMADDSPKLKEVKTKRLRLMEKRLTSFGKAKENKEIVSAQLQTIDEMAQYIKDTPVSLKNTDPETSLIDSILQETENMEDTINDLESVINSDYTVGDYGDMGMNDLTSNAEEVRN